MALLRDWVKELAALVVLAGALEMMLPENRLRGYVRLVMGLTVMLAMLRPAFALLRQPVHLDLEAYALPAAGRPGGPAGLEREAERYRAGTAALAAAYFRRQVADTAAGLAARVPGAGPARVEVELGRPAGDGPPPIERVRVVLGPGTPPEVLAAVQAAVAGGLGLDPGRVTAAAVTGGSGPPRP